MQKVENRQITMNDENDAGEWEAPQPPWTVTLPLHQLEDYLRSLADDDNGEAAEPRTEDSTLTSACATPNRSSHHLQDKQDKILHVADFLFGNMLNSALMLFDSSQPMITKVTAAPSNRSIYLVKASSSSSSNYHRTPRSSPGTPSYYQCIFPEIPSSKHDGNNTTISNNNNRSSSIYYCSCRSFYVNSRSSMAAVATMVATKSSNDKTKRNGEDSSFSGEGTGDLSICKHLLALMLMPHLQVPYQHLTLSSEEEFASLVLDRTFPRV